MLTFLYDNGKNPSLMDAMLLNEYVNVCHTLQSSVKQDSSPFLFSAYQNVYNFRGIYVGLVHL